MALFFERGTEIKRRSSAYSYLGEKDVASKGLLVPSG